MIEEEGVAFHQAGHAYEGKELSGNFNINEGVDLYSKVKLSKAGSACGSHATLLSPSVHFLMILLSPHSQKRRRRKSGKRP